MNGMSLNCVLNNVNLNSDNHKQEEQRSVYALFLWRTFSPHMALSEMGFLYINKSLYQKKKNYPP